MLESEIKKLTAAVTELTAAISRGTVVSAKPASEPSTQGATSDTAPAEASEPAPVAAPKQDVAVATVETPTIPTKKALVEKFIELAQAKDREVAVKLLADFGVAKLPELTDKNKWAPFIARVDVLLAA